MIRNSCRRTEDECPAEDTKDYRPDDGESERGDVPLTGWLSLNGQIPI
jgi:hypothetical protein